MTTYPFIVPGRRLVKVEANGYRNALSKVLSIHPNKFIKTKHARKMDLITAGEEAKKASKSNKKGRYFVVTDASGDADFSSVIKKGEIAHSVYVAGKRVELTPEELGGAIAVPEKNLANKTKLDAVRVSSSKVIQEHKKQIEVENQKTEIMKKASKKVAAKKVAPVSSKSVAKASAPKKVVSGGKKVDISIKQMLLNMKKGFFYRDPQGVRQSENYMKGRANQDHVRTGMVEFKEVAE